MDRGGKVTYKRNPLDPHGAQNFEKSDLYMRSARRNHEPLGTNEHGGVFYRRSDSGGTILHITQYFTPSHFAHAFSNASVSFAIVRRGYAFSEETAVAAMRAGATIT